MSHRVTVPALFEASRLGIDPGKDPLIELFTELESGAFDHPASALTSLTRAASETRSSLDPSSVVPFELVERFAQVFDPSSLVSAILARPPCWLYDTFLEYFGYQRDHMLAMFNTMHVYADAGSVTRLRTAQALLAFTAPTRLRAQGPFADLPALSALSYSSPPDKRLLHRVICQLRDDLDLLRPPARTTAHSTVDQSTSIKEVVVRTADGSLTARDVRFLISTDAVRTAAVDLPIALKVIAPRLTPDRLLWLASSILAASTSPGAWRPREEILWMPEWNETLRCLPFSAAIHVMDVKNVSVSYPQQYREFVDRLLRERTVTDSELAAFTAEQRTLPQILAVVN